MGAASDGERFLETESAVRRLLEAAVPSPAAPADRLARISRRSRRRRRRAAAVTALVTAAVLIGVVSGQRGATATHRGEPAVAPSATTATVGAPVRLLGPDRPLTVELPEGWHALTVEGARGSRAAFLSTQPLSRPTPEGCLADSAHMFPGCRPVSRLAPGGVLIVLRYGDGRGVGPLRMSVASGIDTCAGVGADGGHSADAGSFEVLFSVCQRGPTARTATVIGEILSEMFPDDGT